MTGGIPPLAAIAVGTLAGIRIVVELVHLRTLELARKALRPKPTVMAGEFCYKSQKPPKGPPEELYCMHPKLHFKIEDPRVCERCKLRVLPYEGFKYFDQINVEGFQVAVLQRILSIATGVLAIWVAYKSAVG
jgi:hypothetical protein